MSDTVDHLRITFSEVTDRGALMVTFELAPEVFQRAAEFSESLQSDRRTPCRLREACLPLLRTAGRALLDQARQSVQESLDAATCELLGEKIAELKNSLPVRGDA